MAQDIDNTQDILDIRDIIERIEELEEVREEFILNENGLTEGDPPSWEEVHQANGVAAEKWDETEEGQELEQLTNFVEEWKGYGGDEQWRGDWYPVTLIRESYFTEYTEELLKDCGYLPNDLPSWIEIDMDATAENVKVDYTEVEFDGVTYLGR